MRSLYVDDIAGTKPKKLVFDKSIYRAKHQEEISRHGRNPEEKRIIDWYLSPRRPYQPVDREKGGNRSLSSGLSVFDLFENKSARSQVSSQVKKQKLDGQHLNRSSILTSGRNSLTTSQVQGDPYFPHRYAEPKAGQTNRWSGNRSWLEQPTHSVHMPSTKNEYYPRWK